MKNSKSYFKHNRILNLCMKLIDGEIINKKDELEKYGGNERSIQRDLDDLRVFFENRGMRMGIRQEIIYDRSLKGYYLYYENNKQMTNGEVFAISKILLESRAFARAELNKILDKIINNCVPSVDIKNIESLIANEKFYYVEPTHKRNIIEKMWDIASAIRERKKINIEYIRLDGTIVNRRVLPVGIMFSEFYFYMPAFIENIDKEKEFENKDDIYPTIYRIDRILKYAITNECFIVPYSKRFQEDEFRKRVQFMYGGKLQTVRFEFKGPCIEAVLDRLPTAIIEKEENSVYTVRAEVFGKGIDMWLRSQGDNVYLISN
ncbi:MAG: helix-turn-helix transcriptional regulator [Lachnospirales bacterium]